MIKITKSGFYKLSNLNEKNIEISKNISTVFFDDGKNDKKIKIGENSEVHICGFLEKESKYSLEIIQNGKKSKLFLNYLIFSENSEKIKAKIYSKIKSDFSESYLNIIALASENSEINLDGILEFEKNFKNMKGKLSEENIFLGENAKISAIPSLFVKSNSVEASHSCKIHKISDEKLFYLRSRGIEEKDSVFFLIQGKIQIIFGKIKDYDLEFFTKICKNVMNLLKKSGKTNEKCYFCEDKRNLRKDGKSRI